uniref:Uncharacterized protein n=1 Tax=Timema shepardi TaxID=629360 RepID=A0A7R9B5Z5_TIMSH|nr:unnamed protein product [Timema shepardi]
MAVANESIDTSSLKISTKLHIKMTRYKQAEFEDEDSSSVGSVQLTEGVSATSTHIRYHSGATLWKTRSLLEKCLLLITAILLLVVFIMGTLLSVTVRNENAMQVLHVGPHTAVHPTEIRTSISPSSAVEQLNTTNALANYATEAGAHHLCG